MTEIGFASDFGGQGTRLCDVKATLEKIAKAGFTHIHWCHEWDGLIIIIPTQRWN